MNKFKKLKERYEGYKFPIEEPILDIGGGDGVFLRTQGINKATILDFKKYNNEFEYINADLTKEIPTTKKFRTIFLMEFLEHIKNPLYVLAKAHDLLTDNGVIYLSVPYTEISDEIHHVSRWKLKNLLEQVDKLGFESKVIQKRRRFKGLGFWLPHCWIVLKLKKRKINYNSVDVGRYLK